MYAELVDTKGLADIEGKVYKVIETTEGLLNKKLMFSVDIDGKIVKLYADRFIIVNRIKNKPKEIL